LSIYNNSSADTANHLVILNSSGEVTVQLNGSKNYNYTVADENTTLNYSGYGSGDIVPDKDIIVSKGETDDKYGFKFTAETDVIIDDMGGNDSLSILSGSNWYNQSDDVRLFFDVDYQGNVGESSNLIYKDCFTADNAKNIANLLDGVHTMKGVITFNGELESFETRDYSSSYLVTNGIIKLNEWKQAIAKNVSAWLQANGYRDVKQALATGNRALISAMIKLFDVTYSDAKAGNLEFSLYTDKSDNNVQTTLIKGTAARDYINLPDNTGSRFVVKSDNGDDVIKGNADNSYIDTGEGSDFINVTGNNNVINAGDSYNVINITGTGENSTNTLEVSGDNGATDLIKANNTNLTLKFDEKSIYLNFFKLGDRLGIKYHPSGSNHYLYLDNYFKEGNNVEYTAVCADKTITIKDLLQEWQSKDNVLQEGTTSYYDGVNIEIPSNTANDITVNSSYSSDKITGENLENVTINANVYGDEINISGTNNIIKSGEGRDYTYVRGAGENSSNTVVYANDGCRDTLGGENTALTLQFKDSVYSDIKLSRVEDRLVIVYGNSYNVSYTYNNSGNTLKYAYSVSLENYFTQSNETKPRYTLEFKSDIGIDMEGKDGTKISLDDFITYYTAQYGDIVTVTNLTQIEGESYADIINIPKISGLTVDSKGGNDRIIGKDIENVTVLTGAGNDEVDISGYGNTITGGTGDDLIKVNTDTENGTNTLNFAQGDGNDIVLTNKATLYFTDTELESISLEKQGDNLIIRYSEDDSVTLEKYFNANVENAYTLKYKDGETTGTQSLDTYVSEYGDIPDVITYDVAGTDGDDTFLITERGSKVYLGEGNDTVYISNSAGGNTIISGTKTSSGYATNTDMLVFSDTTVTFSTSGDDLIISSEDFDSPIVYKDYLVFSEKHADLIVKDKENTYKIHTDKDKGDTQWYKYYENSSNPDYDSEYNHIGYYNDAPGTIQTNGKTSVINTLSGDGLLYGLSSDYDTTEKGLVTFNAANPSSGNSYTIQNFTNESGILINDAGGNDSISFNKNTISSDKIRIFFDVIKENGVYHSDFHGMFVHSDTLFDYDKLLSALDEDWTPTHSGIIKFDAFDNQ
ncbi:hypothetical protein II810_04140, partial [bacterium]|nr:hypothetical protein [bacterium]